MLRPVRLMKPQMLSQWLRRQGVQIDAWGRAGSKSVHDLWQEVQHGESLLFEPPARRVVRVAVLHIWQDRRRLLESAQELKSGDMRFRESVPAEKLRYGETYEQAAVRCLREELHLDNTSITSIRRSKGALKIGDGASRSYPGLRSRYERIAFDVVVKGLPLEPFWVPDGDLAGTGPVLRQRFRWVDGETRLNPWFDPAA